MITERTVFILGAGASWPYGFPTGKQLRRKICEDFLPKLKALTEESLPPLRKGEMIRIAKKFVPAFHDSGNESIDLWLNRNQQYSEIGKSAIALYILDAERESRYYEDVPDEEDWCQYLYTRMTGTLIEPDSYELFKDNTVSFITFNYDRSLEHYLYQCYTNSFTLLQKEIGPFRRGFPYERVLKLFPFQPLHVFGKIADLAWENDTGLNYSPSETESPSIYLLQRKIRTIFEGTDDEFSQRIKNQIANAKRVFFLGFGYHLENLKILGIPGVLNNGHRVYGTALGLTEREIEQTREALYQGLPITNIGPPQGRFPIVKDMNCYQLLREYL